MSTRFIVVRLADNVIVNAVMLEADWQDSSSSNYWPIPGDHILIPHDLAGVGWTWNGNAWQPPAAPPDPPPSAEQLRAATFVAQADRVDLISRLQTATPAQIDAWLTANVTNLAQARTVLGAVIKVLALNIAR